MSLRHLLILSLLASPLAPADTAWKHGIGPAAPGDFPPLRSSVLDLQVSWKGIIDSGVVRMEFAPKNVNKPGSLVVRSSATSLGPAAALFPYRGHSWVELDPTSFRPSFFHSQETNSKESINTTTRFYQNKVTCRETTTPKDKPTGTTKEHSFTFSPVFDIFSAILLIRSQKLADGDRMQLVIHPFNNPYLLTIKVVAHEVHLDRNTIRLSVGMHKIDRKNHALKPYKKIKRDATLWLSDDADRIPIELRAAVFIGDIRATLTSFRKL